MSARHTPTPWRRESGTTLIWGDCAINEDGTVDRLGVPVATTSRSATYGQMTSDEAVANADFIVLAVNSHHGISDLITAIRAARSKLALVVDDATGLADEAWRVLDAVLLKVGAQDDAGNPLPLGDME